MLLDFIMFSVTVLVLGWAFDQRNARILVQRELKKERDMTKTLGVMNGNLRARLDEAQHRLAETGGMGSPGPRSERRRRCE